MKGSLMHNLIRYVVILITLLMSYPLAASDLNPGNDGAYSLIAPHRDVRINIFLHLDPASSVAASMVCRRWQSDILAAIEQVQNAWKSGAKTPAQLRRHLFHPLAALRLFEEVSLSTPVKAIRRTAASALEDLGPNPALVYEFVHEVSSSPYLARALCNHTLLLDPGRDFRKVCLMARIVRHDCSSVLRDQLYTILERQIDFARDVPRFSWICSSVGYQKTVRKSMRKLLIQLAKKTLMSAKLLALNDWAVGDGGLLHNNAEILKVILSNHSTSLIIEEEFDSLFVKNPCNSLWACYADEEHSLVSYSLMLQNPALLRNVDHLRSVRDFTGYVLELFQRKTTMDVDYLLLLTSTYCEYVGDHQGQINYLNQIIDGVNSNSSLYLIVRAQQALVEETGMLGFVLQRDKTAYSRYEKLYQLLKDHLDRKPINSPERTLIFYMLAESIIFYKDLKNFEEAGAYLIAVSKHLTHGNKTIDVKFENSMTLTCELNVRDLFTARSIYLGNFDEALTWIEGHRLTPMLSLVCAIKDQMNNPAFPDKLVRIIGKNLVYWTTYFSLFNFKAKPGSPKTNKGWRAAIALLIDQRFIDKFLKYRPLVRARLQTLFVKEAASSPSFLTKDAP